METPGVDTFAHQPGNQAMTTATLDDDVEEGASIKNIHSVIHAGDKAAFRSSRCASVLGCFNGGGDQRIIACL